MTLWHSAVEAELRDLLEIPQDTAISATITLGVPEGSHGPVRRRPLGELVFDDTCGAVAGWAVEPAGARHTSAGPPRRPSASPS
jgi:hypothetical protein